MHPANQYSPSPSPAPPTSPQHHTSYQSQSQGVNGASSQPSAARYSLLNKLQHGHFMGPAQAQQQSQPPQHAPFYSNSGPAFQNGHLHHNPGGPHSHHLAQLGHQNANSNSGHGSSSATGSGNLSPHMQLQMTLANVSRTNNQPHHHARIAHLANRGVGPSAAVAIMNPNRPPSSGKNMNGHSKHDSSGLDSDPTRSSSAASMRTGGAIKEKEHASPTAEPASVATGEKESSWSSIDMGGMALKNISPELFRYTFLTVLYLPHNAISTLSPAVSRLTNLTVLDLSSNKLSSLPPELGLLTNLRELLLFDNYLTSLPPELGTLYMLDTFGIEGNPLPDNIRSLVEKEGTTALIAYLRDSCPVPLPPPERDWISIEETLPSAIEQKTESFSLLSYNTLCEKYATPQMYGYTPSWALGWDYRKELIMQEINNYAADIICLQEVDGKQYEEFFLENLSSEYDGVYYPKSRARTMSGEEKRQVDGCATFFKSSAFALVETHLVEFNQIAMRRPDFKKTEDMFNRVMTKDNIAVITLLENRHSGARLIVANVHTTWDPEFRDVKLVQVAMLMDELRRIADDFARLPSRLNLSEGYDKAPTYANGTKIPTVVCGDFNSEPDSGVYEFFTRGVVPHNHVDFKNHVYGTYTSEGLSHRFSLRSAYSHVGELPLTNHTPDFDGAIDHIFYTTNSLAVTGLLGEIDKDYLSHVVGFPNAHFPSDHICVLAEFKMK